jgi:hypothetical protein
LNTDEHSVSIPADVPAQAQSPAEQLRTLLNPYVHPLTPAERHDIPKMGEKTFSFVEKAFEPAGLNPDLRPSYPVQNPSTKSLKSVFRTSNATATAKLSPNSRLSARHFSPDVPCFPLRARFVTLGASSFVS